MINKLKAARRSAGLSEEVVGTRIGVDAQTVKRLEKGVGSVATVVALMAALDYRLTGLGAGATLTHQLRSRWIRRSMSIMEAPSRADEADTVEQRRHLYTVVTPVRAWTGSAPACRPHRLEKSWR